MRLRQPPTPPRPNYAMYAPDYNQAYVVEYEPPLAAASMAYASGTGNRRDAAPEPFAVGQPLQENDLQRPLPAQTAAQIANGYTPAGISTAAWTMPSRLSQQQTTSQGGQGYRRHPTAPDTLTAPHSHFFVAPHLYSSVLSRRTGPVSTLRRRRPWITQQRADRYAALAQQPPQSTAYASSRPSYRYGHARRRPRPPLVKFERNKNPFFV